jgi:hypothetical protein
MRRPTSTDLSTCCNWRAETFTDITFPQIDYKKLQTFGFKTEASARVSWNNVRKKVEELAAAASKADGKGKDEGMKCFVFALSLALHLFLKSCRLLHWHTQPVFTATGALPVLNDLHSPILTHPLSGDEEAAADGDDAPAARPKAKTTKRKQTVKIEDDDGDDAETEVPVKKSRKAPSKKPKVAAAADEDGEGEAGEEGAKKAPAKKARANKGNKGKVAEAEAAEEGEGEAATAEEWAVASWLAFDS